MIEMLNQRTKINKIDEDIFKVVDKFIEDDLCIQIQVIEFIHY